MGEKEQELRKLFIIEKRISFFPQQVTPGGLGTLWGDGNQTQVRRVQGSSLLAVLSPPPPLHAIIFKL